jgi:hypothetical protein
MRVSRKCSDAAILPLYTQAVDNENQCRKESLAKQSELEVSVACIAILCKSVCKPLHPPSQLTD